MNFYDVYTTLSLNPETEGTLVKIAEFLNCQNQLDSMKEALFKKPNRVQFPGAFPFDEETGKIYDALWKAADAEHFSTAGKVGRWLMKFICPPADDEGMAAYHKRPANDYPPQSNQHTSKQNEGNNYSNNNNNNANSNSYENGDDKPLVVNSVESENVATNEPEKNWEMSEDEDNVIVLENAPKTKKDDVVKRSSKKGD